MTAASKAVAKTATTAVARGPLPEGFDSVQSDDLVAPRIKLWSPNTKIDIENGKLGQFYNVNDKKAIGDEISFFLLSQKTIKFENKDEDGEIKIKTYKYLLVALETEMRFPFELILSATSIIEVKRLVSSLLVKSQDAGGSPMYGFLVKANTITKESKEGGRYAIANFTVVRDMTDDEFGKLGDLYQQYAKNYLHEVVVPAEEAMAE